MRKITMQLLMLAGIGVSVFSCKPTDIQQQSSSNSINNTDLSAAQAAGLNYVPNEVLIKFVAGTTDTRKNEILAKIQGKVKEQVLTKIMQALGDNEGITLVRIPLQALDAIAKLNGISEIEYAEPNFIYTHDAVSNDTYFTSGSLWGMYGATTTPANQYGSQAAVAWANNHTGASTVYVGIIDEGYMYTHTDLAANAGVNPKEIAGNGIDDDKNGYIDDVYGWDFDGNNNTVFDGINDDHGTHVAGTIGGVGGNSAGVAGICWNVKLMDAKFLGVNGGTTANAIKAVDYFTNMKVKNGVNIVATNNSWGGGGYSKGLYDAIQRANNAGILFIAAAGNAGSNNDVSASYPSNYKNTNVIAVAAIGSDGTLAYFSNYGAKTVHLGAPGVSIVSTVPVSSNGSIVSGYATYSGTSMATPHVTGSVALYASTHAGATATSIKSYILANTTPTSSLSGKTITGGRLNVSTF